MEFSLSFSVQAESYMNNMEHLLNLYPSWPLYSEN